MKFLFSLLLIFSAQASFAKMKIVATTTDMGALAREVGKDKVVVVSIAKGTQDPHQIEAKPSFMIKMRDADLVVAQGLELESAWILPLIQGARNPKITVGGKGFFELAGLVNPIEIPKGTVSRAEGDVHPGGNPHFQLDPIRMGQAAVLLAARMDELDPSNKAFYDGNAQAFQKHMEQKTSEWRARLEKTGIKAITTYHKTFSYFCERFQIQCALQLEPRPGIPPTASHLMEVIDQMKQKGIRLVLIENYFDDSVAGKLKSEIPDVTVKRVAVSVDGDDRSPTIEALIENLVKTFEAAKK